MRIRIPEDITGEFLSELLDKFFLTSPKEDFLTCYIELEDAEVSFLVKRSDWYRGWYQRGILQNLSSENPQ
jgi:hypothetical protein